ncbi:glycosyl transferase [Sphingobacterium sp. CZ-UAM]|uniref:glycosyltransferase family 32 protein n=1 Tax=Sphingobacterium sp. CZ-UAM TaxID=1933868 RepID=UPI0009854422|nr:glycosyltransferase [Sphingobacterium sp. CZ-UAM]OOG20368.1 glycosyl transferase [Sphingobacterium sp. CZ-UAM]
MIPKIIHYCWFGRGPLPALAEKCIRSWKTYLPEYQIVCWNEDNFDLSQYPYAKAAYQERKFAFVTDVCRLHALREMGGIYMDTDVEILKPLDGFLLQHRAFSGFEDNFFVPTGLMASEKEGRWVSDLLALYENRSFYQSDGSLDLTTNTQTITEFMRDYKGLMLDNTLQELVDYCTLYPSDFFCPKSWQTLAVNITNNTYCIHHFAGSWQAKPVLNWRYKTIRFFLGKRRTKVLFAYYQHLKP